MEQREKNSWWKKIAWGTVIVAGFVSLVAGIGIYYFFRMIGFKWLIGLIIFLGITYILLVRMNEPEGEE